MWNTYYRDRLSESEQAAYDDLCRGLSLCQREISVRPVGDISRVIEAVKLEHPEFFHVNWMDRIFYRAHAKDAVVFVRYIYGEAEIAALGAKMNAIASSIAGISEYGKALGVHDWFARNVKYDRKGLDAPIRSPGMFSAAGPLISKKAVCAGISGLACHLLRKKGLDAAVVVGTSSSGVAHAWNVLRVEGQDLYADITYDIGLSTAKRIAYKYFLLTREQMAEDHTIRYV